MTLERWLEFATRGLAPAAAERVRREYAAAFEDAQAAGEWPYEILAGWGDPHRVGRELRRVHLTEQEARALHPGYAPTWAGLRQALGEDLGFIVGPALIVTLQMVRGEAGSAPAFWGWAGIVLLLTGLRWLVVSRLASRVRWRVVASWLLHPWTVLSGLLVGITVASLKSGREPLGGLRPGPDATLLEYVFILGLALLPLSHLLRLPTSLRAAAKQEGETA
ncbi:hypothetical protein L1280_001467 [Deinococcus sp. HSC-46F16]|uniref:hypothetical protein n=1 Tax=Deinococcus sp. HSC-46F16 TaxID=2910968 RepID=UPI00209DAC3E|nr:hypothetical protein [Deinococcus sp. HSC-46F16]MCP2014330.1 hypothetical protein [Deinococcus sp. HSC-46F16]